MKIERLNENQIRCTLSKSELEERSLKISELASGSQKANELLHDLIDQAMEELDFNIDGHPIMVEARPGSSGIVLVITRVDSAQDIKNHLAQLGALRGLKHIGRTDAEQAETDELPDPQDCLAPEAAPEDPDGLDDLDDLNDFNDPGPEDMLSDSEDDREAQEGSFSPRDLLELFRGIGEAIAAAEEERKAQEGTGETARADDTIKTDDTAIVASGDETAMQTPAVSAGTDPAEISAASDPQPEAPLPFRPLTASYLFDTLDDVIDMCSSLPAGLHCVSRLYKDEKRYDYYLTLFSEEGYPEDFNAIRAAASEYGVCCGLNRHNIHYYDEHFTTLIREDVLSALHGL